MSFKDIPDLVLWQPFCSAEPNNICAILVEGILRNNSVNLFEFGPVVQEKSLKDISYLELWLLLCSVERNHLCNFGRRHLKGTIL